MKILANFEKMRVWSLLLTVLGSTMVSCSNILDEEVVDCSLEYRVKFKYDHNMKFADAFANEVRSVTLYAFDHIFTEHLRNQMFDFLQPHTSFGITDRFHCSISDIPLLQ